MGLEALDLYRQIPVHLHDAVLYVCILNACSHSGLRNEAYSIFNKISNKTDIIVTTMVCFLNLVIFLHRYFYLFII